jgi:hypothetical protein
MTDKIKFEDMVVDFVRILVESSKSKDLVVSAIRD